MILPKSKAKTNWLVGILALWTLWYSDSDYDPKTYAPILKQGDVFESRNECRNTVFETIQLREKEVKDQQKFKKFFVSETGMIGYWDQAKDEMKTFVCLPDGRKPEK